MGAATRFHSVVASGFALASMPSISATTCMIPSDYDLTLSMIRPTSISIGFGEGVWSAVVPIGVVLPECAMISQGVTVTINAREIEKVWLQRDCRRVRIPTYLLLDFKARLYILRSV